MSDTTTPADLTIPAEAFRALLDAVADPIMEDVRAIATPVVAAELRRLGDEIERRRHQVDDDAWFDACNMAMDLFRARADELDSGHA